MRFYLIILFFSLCFIASAQTPKGVIGNSTDGSGAGVCRALVIGVSTYKYITQLDYADRDAEEFASFLIDNPAWRVSKDNIVLLTNERAKLGDILTSLSWLTDSSKQGDKLFFYFSGHGDVETIADSSQGFLLAYNSPVNNYATGAISISILQKAFNSIIAKGVKLFLVTDACRAGHLAGGVIGVEQTAKAFSNQWKSQTKILSAQPDELSFEGKTWGGGRGVFSFFLVKGLNGYADINNDSTVTLSELEQYVGLQVAEETKFRQQPVFEGPNKFSNKIARTDIPGMERYSQWKTGSEIAVLVIKDNKEQRSKGAIPGADSAGNCPFYNRLLYLLEKETIDSAEWKTVMQLYNSVLSCAIQQLINKSRYKISAALMNDVQQVVNQTLVGQKLIGKGEIDDALKKIGWLENLNKKSELIYADHIASIKKYLLVINLSLMEEFERQQYANSNDLAGMIDSAIALEPNTAYLFQAKGVLFAATQTEKNDSAIYYFKRTIQFSPTWLIPKLLIGNIYNKIGKTDSAIFWYEEILRMDTLFQKFECAVCFFQELGDLYRRSKQYIAAEDIYKKALLIDPKNIRCMCGLIQVYAAAGSKKQTEYWLNLVEMYDTLPADKIETLQLIIENKILKKGDVEKRLDRIKNELSGDDGIALYYFTMGLFKDYYRLGNSLNDYGKALEIITSSSRWQEADHVEYRLAFMESKLKNGKWNFLGDNIEFIMSRYEVYLSRADRARLELANAMYLLLADPVSEKAEAARNPYMYGEKPDEFYEAPERYKKAIDILNKLFSSGAIRCKEIQEIKSMLTEMRKKTPAAAITESFQAQCQ